MNMIDERSPTAPKKHRRLKKSWRILSWMILCIAGIVAALLALYYYTDIPLALHSVYSVKTSFSVRGQEIVRKQRSSETPFIVQGVHIDPVVGEDTYSQYLELLRLASELSANTVVVDDVMEPAFYQALQTYNSSSGSHLYLLQGIRLSDESYASMQDAYEGGMRKLLVRRGKLAIDAVHGTRRTATDSYAADVSEDTLGYLVGQDWDSELVLYTDYVYANNPQRFNGKYVRAYETAGAFDTLLARVFDRLFAYETGKFGEQHLMGLVNGQRTDPLFHDTTWCPGLNENLAHVNAEVLSPQGTVQSGIFAAYHVDTGILQTLSYDPAYCNATNAEGQANPYLAYLTALKQYHVNKPVLLSEVSVSSARGVSGIDAVMKIDRGGLSESEQAYSLLRLCMASADAGLSGVCIDSLVDNPLLRAWNIDGVSDYDGSWLNSEDSEQSLGLIALEPGATSSVCTVDGENNEWANTPAVLSKDGLMLQLQSDEKYLYLLVTIPSYNANRDVVYIPFDITPGSGTTSFETQNLTFDRNVDFMLTINGDRRARLNVQEYYDKLNAYRSLDINLTLALTNPPQADSGVFFTVGQFARKRLAKEVGEIAQNPVVLETGLLRYGNADPDAADYDSLADYCINANCVEVRIPWTLLNFVNPAQGLIEGDLFSVAREPIAIDSMYVSMIVSKSNQLTALSSAEYRLARWADGEFHFRKKLAFDTIGDWFS